MNRKSSRPAAGEPEKRRASRRDISYPVSIETVMDGTVHRCMILDISETGARLSLDQAGTLPEEFILRLAGHRAARRLCQLVWRDGNMIGVRFIETAES